MLLLTLGIVIRIYFLMNLTYSNEKISWEFNPKKISHDELSDKYKGITMEKAHDRKDTFIFKNKATSSLMILKKNHFESNMEYLRCLALLKTFLRPNYQYLMEMIDFPINFYYSENETNKEKDNFDFLIESVWMEGNLVDYINKHKSFNFLKIQNFKPFHKFYDFIRVFGKIKVYQRNLTLENILFLENDKELIVKVTDFELTNFKNNIHHDYFIAWYYSYPIQSLYFSEIHILDLEFLAIFIIILVVLLSFFMENEFKIYQSDERLTRILGSIKLENNFVAMKDREDLEQIDKELNYTEIFTFFENSKEKNEFKINISKALNLQYSDKI